MKRASGKRNHIPQQSATFFLLAVLVCCFPLVFFENPTAKGYLLIFSFLFYFATIYFWVRFIPFITPGKYNFFKLAYTIFSITFNRRRTLYRVESGIFEKDYFSLKHKPPIHVLLIDNQSAVISKSRISGKRLLSQGFWQLRRGEEVTHVFDLRPTQFYWGPNTSQNPFHISKSFSSSFVKANTLSLALECTKCKTKEGRTIAPAFSVFYVIKPCAMLDSSENNLLSLSNQFNNQGITGQLKTAINTSIGKMITRQFKQVVTETNFLLTHKDQQNIRRHFQNQLDDRIDLFQLIQVTEDPLEKHLLTCIALRVYLTEVWVK